MERNKGGRPRKDATAAAGPATTYGSAREYLAAVISGAEKPNAVRVAAARAMLSYESPRLQGPMISPSNVVLARKSERKQATLAGAEWKKKEAEIRAKHRRNGST